MALVSAGSFAPSAPLLLRLAAGADDFTAGLPHCAILCVEKFCAPSNRTCTCGPEKEAIDHCVLVSCPTPAAIFTRKSTETMCDTPIRDRRVKFNVMIVTMTCIAAVNIVTRLLYKQFFSVGKRLNSEDWTIVVASVLGLASVALTIFGLTAHGLGKDIWGLGSPDLIAFGRSFYAIQILYILLMLLVKLTLTLFYLNIFPGPKVRILLRATVVFHILTATTFTIGLIFQCIPINYQWQRYDYESDMPVNGHCINVNAGAWANSAVSVASDIWLLAIPLTQLHKLRLHWKKKLCAGIMFFTGVIVTVVSFLRLASIGNYASTSNPTWDQWSIVWWSTIELEVGLICTCLPTMRLVLVRIALRAFGTDGTASSMNISTRESDRPYNSQHDVDEEATFDEVLPKRSSAPAASLLQSRQEHDKHQSIYSLQEQLSRVELDIAKPNDVWQGHWPSHPTKPQASWRGTI